MFGVEFGLFFLIILFYVLYKRSGGKRAELLRKLPGPKPLPILGNVAFQLKKPKTVHPITHFFQYQEGKVHIYGKEKMHLMWIGNDPILFLIAPETIEAIVSSSTAIQKGSIYKFLEPWLGDGLLLSTGEKWKKHRKLLTPSFHFKILEKFEPVMNEQAAVLVKKIREFSSQSDWVDAFELYSKCALDIIFETAMGISVGAQERDSKFGKMINHVGFGLTYRSSRPWLRPDFIFWFTKLKKTTDEAIKYLHSVSEKVIANKIAERKGINEGPSTAEEPVSEFATKKRLAFLDLLLESDLTKQELREQVDTFMFAGHDTTSVALGWMTYLLGLDSSVQEKLIEEIDSVFGDDKTRDVTPDDLKELRYMDIVIKECQRVYPSVPGISRNLDKDTLIGEYAVPKGVECFISIYSLHHNAEHFPNPELFDPERFAPENSSGRHPYCFLPFSAGPRNCIGQKFALMEQKIIICHVLRNFTILSLDPRDQIKLVPELVLRTADPVRTKFIARE